MLSGGCASNDSAGRVDRQPSGKRRRGVVIGAFADTLQQRRVGRNRDALRVPTDLVRVGQRIRGDVEEATERNLLPRVLGRKPLQLKPLLVVHQEEDADLDVANRSDAQIHLARAVVVADVKAVVLLQKVVPVVHEEPVTRPQAAGAGAAQAQSPGADL